MVLLTAFQVITRARRTDKSRNREHDNVVIQQIFTKLSKYGDRAEHGYSRG